jgi:hypothetical protein
LISSLDVPTAFVSLLGCKTNAWTFLVHAYGEMKKEKIGDIHSLEKPGTLYPGELADMHSLTSKAHGMKHGA